METYKIVDTYIIERRYIWFTSYYPFILCLMPKVQLVYVSYQYYRTRTVLEHGSHNPARPARHQARDQNLLRLRVRQRVHGGSVQNLWGAFEENQPRPPLHHLWHQSVVRFHQSGRITVQYCSLINNVGFTLHAAGRSVLPSVPEVNQHVCSVQ